MLSSCPHCRKSLHLSQAQQDKVQSALAALPEGKTLRMTCPRCRQPIHLRKDNTAVEEGQVMDKVLYGEQEGDAGQAAERIVEQARETPRQHKPPPAAPAPPDVGWLAAGEYAEQEVVKNVPLAMVLMADGPSRTAVAEAFSGEGFQPEFPESAEAAMERMRFVTFSAVALHSGFEGGGLAGSRFHAHLCGLPMAVRRPIFYLLIGPEFHTLYDLEALTLSANLVVNDNDLQHLPVILKKGVHDHQQLFGPFLEALAAHGR